MMSLKKTSLLVLTLVATCVFWGCGEEPDNENVQQDSGPGGGTDTSVATVDSSPIQQLSTLIGKTYILDFAVQYWIKPGGTPGEELGGYTPKFTFEFKTVDEAQNTFTALLGTAKNGAQDICNKTYTITGTLDTSLSTGPTKFVTDPIDIDAIIEGPDVKVLSTLRGFTLNGEFFDQGAGYKAGGIKAELDGGQIFSLFTLMDPVPTSADVLCDNLFNLGVDCEACSTDTTVMHCLTVEAALFKINEAVGLTLVEVAATDQTCL